MATFERAQKFAPAVVLFDEIDSIAPSRSAESAQHQVSTVAQLLVLLDGIEARGQVFVLATTNRPEHVDPALRRPGRFDQVVWMGLPDEHGRADVFEHYFRGLKLVPPLAPNRLAAELASDGRLGRFAVKANLALIKISKTLFSYQIYVEAETTPDVRFVLRDTQEKSAKRAPKLRSIGTAGPNLSR